MLFRFRICCDPQNADDAQGWVIAPSEMAARSLFVDEVQLYRMLGADTFGAPEFTIFVTVGALSKNGLSDHLDGECFRVSPPA
jgi:hypothetical protein